MAFKVIQIGNATNIPTNNYKCDTSAEMAQIDVSHVAMGSTCYVISEGKIYVLNSQGQWKIKK